MNLIKTSVLNGIAVVTKMLALLGINKILALYVGPAGYAAFGQFQNVVALITTLIGGAFNTGVTKYTAEYVDDASRRVAVWRTAGTLSVGVSLVIACVLFFFRERLAEKFLNDGSLADVFAWFAAGLVFLILNTFLLAVLNGLKEIARYVVCNIVGSFLSVLITAVLVHLYGLKGALIALATYQSVAFFSTLAVCCRLKFFNFSSLFGRLDKEVVKNLLKYAVMAIVSAACLPVTQMLIRSEIGQTLGWTAAGYWEAMWRLSSAYLMMATTTLSIYFLPRLSELKTYRELMAEIGFGYRVILPLTALAAVSIYVLREPIVLFLFSADFAPVTDLFAWQLVGDALKIGSWIIAYVMLGKAMFKAFIFTEIIGSFLFYVLAVVLIRAVGLEGVVMAYAINYAVYWVLVWVVIRRSLQSMRHAAETA
ncbi:TPA: O-antigen translocase [Pseudomonas putida]|uniref:O-antigen translocase n=1 Tax=Pseudomonas putida TaxID=303 RepID=UPI00236413AE|nr:O-antigen translocase [Pseudomonas putida]MDD2151120.1 O-antigen translocase [Pseudomonas putida]HDS1681671.1 O-antigen translocase [Pseudomonas putida]